MPGVSDYLDGLVQSLSATRRHGLDAKMDQAIAWITEALSAGHPLLVCGNGASASDALRIAAELVGRHALERRALNVLALTANPSMLTGWANDYAYETAFARQVEAHGAPGAVLLGLSTSGNSVSVVRALEAARKQGMTTIGMTGAGGGSMAPLCDILLDVPERATPRIQQVHVCLYHYLCQQVERRIAAQA